MIGLDVATHPRDAAVEGGVLRPRAGPHSATGGAWLRHEGVRAESQDGRLCRCDQMAACPCDVYLNSRPCGVIFRRGNPSRWRASSKRDPSDLTPDLRAGGPGYRYHTRLDVGNMSSTLVDVSRRFPSLNSIVFSCPSLDESRACPEGVRNKRAGPGATLPNRPSGSCDL